MDLQGPPDLQDQSVQQELKDFLDRRESQASVSEERKEPPARKGTRETEAILDCLV